MCPCMGVIQGAGVGCLAFLKCAPPPQPGPPVCSPYCVSSEPTQEETTSSFIASGASWKPSHQCWSGWVGLLLSLCYYTSSVPPCPSPTPGVYSNSSSLSRWCHTTISSSVVPFSCPQSFPASGFFQKSQFFTSGGQSIGVSASTSVLPMNTQDWSPLGWTGWISSKSKGLSRVFSNTTVRKHQFFGAQLSL